VPPGAATEPAILIVIETELEAVETSMLMFGTPPVDEVPTAMLEFVGAAAIAGDTKAPIMATAVIMAASLWFFMGRNLSYFQRC
jgi:hypothetical protein